MLNLGVSNNIIDDIGLLQLNVKKKYFEYALFVNSILYDP